MINGTFNTSSIVYVENKNIDKAKWDKCIDEASNGLIYAYSFYLDAMAKHWDVIVVNDYETVMPLTWNKKYGIYYLCQPFFTASLGVFGNNLSAELMEKFLNNIPAKFKYCDIYLNRENVYPVKKFSFCERRNYVLNLNNSYQNIYSSFSQNHKRNISKAERLNLSVKKNIPFENVTGLAKEQSMKFSTITNKEYDKFLKLCHYLKAADKAVAYGVFNQQDKLLASCVYFFSHNRAYYILAGNHPVGRNYGASHFLINAFIKEHAGQNLLLDFEGSQVKTLAHFYKSFGADAEIFVGLKFNKLPGVLKLFKK